MKSALALEACFAGSMIEPAIPRTSSKPSKTEGNFDEFLDEAFAGQAEVKSRDDEEGPAETVITIVYVPPPPVADEVVIETAIDETMTIAPQAGDEKESFFTETSVASAPFENAESFAKSGMEGVALDAKLFTPVEPRPVAELTNQAPPTEAPPAETASPPDGTVVAHHENRVKHSEKTADFALAAEQKLPPQGAARRFVTPVTPAEAAHLLEARSSLEADFSTEPAIDIAPASSAQTVEVIDNISAEVSRLRLRGGSEVSVSVRAENGPELQVELRLTRDGVVHAIARCEQKDAATLNQEWPRLQQSLALMGVRMADLSSGENPDRSSANTNPWTDSQDSNPNSRYSNPREPETTFYADREPVRKAANPQPTALVIPAPAMNRGWQALA